ncbi:MAG: thiol peroxidase [Candidatus Margulisiibacteriota bacterium]
MATTLFKGNQTETSGTLPAVGTQIGDFALVRNDLSEATLATYAGQKKVLNIFPSLDTGVCAASVRAFNQKAAGLENTVVLCISKDLPFAQKRFCGAEGIDKVETLSAFRSSLAKDYGLELLGSPLKGLMARTVIVLNEANQVLYVELVPEVTTEPNYDAALAVL